MHNLDKSEENNIIKDNNLEILSCTQHKNFRSYELTLLCFNQYNDEVIKSTICDIFNNIDKETYSITKINDVVRYDIIYMRKQIKTNMITVYFNSIPSVIDRISLSVKKQSKVVIKYIIIAHHKLKNKLFDYKKPISMKKHFLNHKDLCQ